MAEQPVRILLASLSNVTWLGQLLLGRGAQVAALLPHYANLGEFGQTRAAELQDLPFEVYAKPVLSRLPYPYSVFLRGVASTLRQFQPDVVFALGEPSELPMAQVIRLTNRLLPQTRTVAYTFENVDRNWRGFPRCLRGRAEWDALTRLDLILTASQSAADRLQRLGYPRERLRVVYMGKGLSDITREQSTVRQQLSIGDDEFLIGFIGRLVPEKGLDLLLEALTKLPPQFRLVLVGAGREEAALRSLAERLGVAKRVHWAGRIAREAVPQYQAALDALVLPSRRTPDWEEQFGMVLVEAMAAGTPVIGSATGAIPEIIGDGGLTFKEGDIAGLVAMLQKLEGDTALRQELGRRGYARAHMLFTAEAFADRVLAALEAAQALPAAHRSATCHHS